MKFLFLPMDGAGHINACVGVANLLKKHQHECIFSVVKTWSAIVEKHGFQTESYSDPSSDGEDPQAKWGKFMREVAFAYKLSPIEQIATLELPAFDDFLKTTQKFDPHFKQLIQRIKPDAILVDFYCAVPSVINSGLPWFYIWSCNPLLAYEQYGGPPAFSGFSKGDDPKAIEEFIKTQAKLFEPLKTKSNEWLRSEGIEPHPTYMHLPSPYLNIYAFPRSIDYVELCPNPEGWIQLNHFVRPSEDSPLGIDEKWLENDQGRKLIYFSLGSMGSADVDLMKRLIGFMSKSSHRFIVSKGPFHDEIELPANMIGAKFLNQIKVLPKVDLVITHGGNNTFIETLYFGKPLIVMPLFGDQHDNGRRVADTKIGKCLYPYKVTEEELLKGIDDILNDNELKNRLARIGEEVRNSNDADRLNEQALKIIAKHNESKTDAK
ncbi:NDP-glycosyltransferase YjiC-like [Brevipalpus obovatus]|uniref:NDP-glycosyltransferase YjiC-like n=1 Tax=Brevipalpus obovatus TaxID=246614 RepID=UPI003D9EEAFB